PGQEQRAPNERAQDADGDRREGRRDGADEEADHRTGAPRAERAERAEERVRDLRREESHAGSLRYQTPRNALTYCPDGFHRSPPRVGRAREHPAPGALGRPAPPTPI